MVGGPWSARSATVIGERGVLVLDVSEAVLPSLASSGSSSARISDVRAIRLSEGDNLDLTSLALSPASFKTSMTGRESQEAPATSKDVFAEVQIKSLFPLTSIFYLSVLFESKQEMFEVDLLTSSLLKSKALSTFGVSKEVRDFDVS